MKAIISESSNDSNQALGMSILMCSFGFGLVIGPAVSGAVADPIGQYNLTISGTQCIVLAYHHLRNLVFVCFNLQIQLCEGF